MTGVAIIDYGMGNLHSVAKALNHANSDIKVDVSNEPDRILKAERVIFPGVGALQECMTELQRLGLDEVVRECAVNKPFLGICLGMQALMEESTENGGTKALGIFSGKVARFRNTMTDPSTGNRLKVPHMGWNEVHQTQRHPLWHGIAQDARFYFVHSYYVELPTKNQLMAETEYGLRFASAMARDNIFAVQFHPEKSQKAGLQLLANFTRWDVDAKIA